MKTQTKSNFPQKYVREIKALFPIIRKQEKSYLKQMKHNIDDYCEQTTVSSMDELYEEFGKPQDVVHSYYSMMDLTLLFSHISLHRLIKRILTCVCIIAFAITVFAGVILYREHLTFMRQEAVFVETIIE